MIKLKWRYEKRYKAWYAPYTIFTECRIKKVKKMFVLDTPDRADKRFKKISSAKKQAQRYKNIMDLK